MKRVRKNCIGCMACVDICPIGCIHKRLTRWDELRTYTDDNECTGCGKCESVCVLNNTMHFKRRVLRCYASWSKTPAIYRNASSGGFITDAYRLLLGRGWYVCGVIFSKEDGLNYYITNNIDDYDIFEGSKYVAIDTTGIFKRIDTLLRENNKVLFVGLPCIVHSLYLFLKCDTDNLLTIDLLCSGVAPSYYFHKYLEWICKKHEISQFNDVRFRGKRGFSFSVLKDNYAVYSKKIGEDYYFAAYQMNILREDKCVHCQWVGADRVGDLTVGDFWGLGKTQKSHPFGANLILANSQKGICLCEDMNELQYMEKREVREAKNGSSILRGEHFSSIPGRLFRFFYIREMFIVLLRIFTKLGGIIYKW